MKIICNRCSKEFTKEEAKILDIRKEDYQNQRLIKFIELPCGHFDTHWISLEND